MEQTGGGPGQREQERERVFDLVQRAFTRAEVEEARTALAAHLEAHPEDEAEDLGHGLPLIVACLRERQEQARQMGLTPEEHHEREELLKRTRVAVDPATDPDCLARIDQAQNEIQQWLARYPDDVAAQSQLQGLGGSKALTRELLQVLREMDAPPST